jgi:hypothetical protein
MDPTPKPQDPGLSEQELYLQFQKFLQEKGLPTDNFNLHVTINSQNTDPKKSLTNESATSNINNSNLNSLILPGSPPEPDDAQITPNSPKDPTKSIQVSAENILCSPEGKSSQNPRPKP